MSTVVEKIDAKVEKLKTDNPQIVNAKPTEQSLQLSADVKAQLRSLKEEKSLSMSNTRSQERSFTR
jgi:hypothetical protein